MVSSFWKTQPVERGESKEIIDNSKKIRKLPITLPEGMSWHLVDDVPKIISFLENFYVEDITSSYRLSYSEDFFNFIFKFPRHRPEYSMGLFHGDRMIGYIMAREHSIVLRENTLDIVSVNFLCLDKEHRNQNLAPLMIQEIRRIANLNGIFQAIFTAEKDYGFSIAQALYYHFPLNRENLMKSGLIDSYHTIQKVPICRNSTRLALETDLPRVYKLYQTSCKKFMLHEEFDYESFFYNFRGQNNAIYTVFNEEHQEFASFFIINTKCLSNGMTIKRAYLYYWAGGSSIVSDAISIADTMQVDMFDLLNLADNDKLTGEIACAEGTGILKYHLYNIKEDSLPQECLDIILF